MAAASASHASSGHPHGLRRWLMSTNHKDIGSLYLMFAMMCGLVGGFFSIGIALAFRSRERAGDNPWGEGATTLEWTLSSPPPFHSFETLPKAGGGAH